MVGHYFPKAQYIRKSIPYHDEFPWLADPSTKVEIQRDSDSGELSVKYTSEVGIVIRQSVPNYPEDYQICRQVWQFILQPIQTSMSYCYHVPPPYLDEDGFQKQSPCLKHYKIAYGFYGVIPEIWEIIISYINTCNWCNACEIHNDHSFCQIEKKVWFDQACEYASLPYKVRDW